MAKSKENGGIGYKILNESIKSGQIGKFYIFYGDERYLLERSLGELRRRLCPEGLSSFNYRRFEGKDIVFNELDAAISTLPVFAERTLVEIHDFDIFGNAEKQRLSELLSDLPDYVCVVLVFDVAPYKPDGRVKADKEILKNAQIVEFPVQSQGVMINWISRHFKDAGKQISTADAEYLVTITGGYMATLHNEIEKTAAYAKAGIVTRADIDAVVTPVLDAVAYKLTDAIVRREYDSAMRVLDELFRMREPPQRIIYSISLKMRQFLAARVCIDKGVGRDALCDMCGIKYEFQAKLLMDTARKTTLADCRAAVRLCAETAYAINISPEPEARLIELIAELAFSKVK